MNSRVRSPFDNLPVELILQVAQYVTPTKLQIFSQASRRLRLVVGPTVYRTQRAHSLDDLAHLRVLADQPDVAQMIVNLHVDANPMRSWWPSTVRLLCSILPKLVNLESLDLQTSHCISNQLSSSICQLRKLHTLNIRLLETQLGPYSHTISHLRHLTVDLPSSPAADLYNDQSFPFEDTIALISNSHNTLESLTLRSSSPESTTNFASHLILSPTRRLQNLVLSAPVLQSISLDLEVNTSTPLTLTAIDAISTLGPKLTSLSLKCKPSMYPEHQPSSGYGIGLEALQRICEKLPELEELLLEDGEVGRSNAHRGAVEVAEDYLKPLRKLQNLRTVKLPLLYDDILYSLDPLHPPSAPDITVHSVFHSAAVAKQGFNAYVDENFTQLLRSIFSCREQTRGPKPTIFSAYNPSP
ncbi:hypothetical protein FRB90_005134 [Tulasnella sp. 427]|nr:hypothetical protein FRB90_005134 [Tulasnella sp. 427]